MGGSLMRIKGAHSRPMQLTGLMIWVASALSAEPFQRATLIGEITFAISPELS
jgi:hypothetical protein